MSSPSGSLEDADPGSSRASPHKSRFSVDDAFEDEAGELGGDKFEFSTEVIREELEKNLQLSSSLSEDAFGFEDIQLQPSFDPDASVSTIDINAPSHTPDSLPQSPPPVEHVSPEIVNFSHEILPTNMTDDGVREGMHQTYPSVVIDLTKTPDSQVIVNTSASFDQPQEPSDSNDSAQPSEELKKPQGTSKADNSFPASRSLPSPSTPRTQTHRPTKSSGPSALEKVISKTRPSFLPPKAKFEDNKHLADWEAMMKQSREAEEKKKKMRLERRLAREKSVEESIPLWEKQILSDWKNASHSPGFKRLWWNGIPAKLRGVIWEKVVGNGLALSKDTYRSCLSRAARALSSGTFPTTTLNLIDADIRSTLPSLHIFTPTSGPLYQDLMNMLCAWVVSRSDEGLGYVMGISKIAVMFLLNMQPAVAFVAMRNLLERHCMRSFYGGLSSRDDVEAYYRIFDTLLADCMPKVYFNFKQHQISPAAYLPDWLIPLFLDHLPLEACARIWDVLLLEGDAFLFRAALAVLGTLESRLYFPDRSELLSLLSGENKPALEIAKRDGTLLGMCKYEIYGIDEEKLWEQIEGQVDWWRESTWTRLVQRELPDL